MSVKITTEIPSSAKPISYTVEVALAPATGTKRKRSDDREERSAAQREVLAIVPELIHNIHSSASNRFLTDDDTVTVVLMWESAVSDREKKTYYAHPDCKMQAMLDSYRIFLDFKESEQVFMKQMCGNMEVTDGIVHGTDTPRKLGFKAGDTARVWLQ
ncbi:uncharacterized protein LTR77_010160 [Saxophila tyrrhenica]|uniref:Uncharacterized protein n=1 Tax=Saxophila tyrrhenica TaxID=1690608 RepID=A0AAV9NXR7_9PEZI|nr:hypothetical protein LTR77_010160 [Saxophila tyrrhenica]